MLFVRCFIGCGFGCGFCDHGCFAAAVLVVIAVAVATAVLLSLTLRLRNDPLKTLKYRHKHNVLTTMTRSHRRNPQPKELGGTWFWGFGASDGFLDSKGTSRNMKASIGFTFNQYNPPIPKPNGQWRPHKKMGLGFGV